MSKQPLGQGQNPRYYYDLVDFPSSEGYQIRHQVIFPTLYRLMRQYALSNPAPLLDHGSGTGSLTSELEQALSLPASGYDPSRVFTRLARQQHPNTPFHHLRPGQLHPVGFGHLNSHLVMHCAPNIDRVIEDIASATMGNGYAFITLPHPKYFKASQPSSSDGAIHTTIGAKAQLAYYRRDLREYEEAFVRHGFEVADYRECRAPKNSQNLSFKYQYDPHFVIYVLKKSIDTIDTVLLNHRETGRYIVATRSRRDDKFPGVRSFVSKRRLGAVSGRQNAAAAIKQRLGLAPHYVSKQPIATMMARDKHADRTQYARVNLYAGYASGNLDDYSRQYFDHVEVLTPAAIRPFGGTCTKLGYQYLQQ